MVFGEIIKSKICTFTLPDWTEAELLSLEMELTRAEPLLLLLLVSLAWLVWLASPPSSWIFMECSLKMAFSRRFSSSNFSRMILSWFGPPWLSRMFSSGLSVATTSGRTTGLDFLKKKLSSLEHKIPYLLPGRDWCYLHWVSACRYPLSLWITSHFAQHQTTSKDRGYF